MKLFFFKSKTPSEPNALPSVEKVMSRVTRSVTNKRKENDDIVHTRKPQQTISSSVDIFLIPHVIQKVSPLSFFLLVQRHKTHKVYLYVCK